MTSKQSTVDFIIDQLSGAGDVTAKKMFGDYGVFLAGRMIALICDDRLFFKPTKSGKFLFSAVTEDIPYPGAKPCFLVSEDDLENADWLAQVALATANELPLPKNKTKKSPRSA